MKKFYLSFFAFGAIGHRFGKALHIQKKRKEKYLEFEKKAGPTTTRLISWQRFLLTHIYPRILNPKVLFHPMC